MRFRLHSRSRSTQARRSPWSRLTKEHGYTLRVTRFAALGFAIPDFRVHEFDLPQGFGIDGLLGLSFLRQFNYAIRSAEVRILVEPVAAGT